MADITKVLMQYVSCGWCVIPCYGKTEGSHRAKQACIRWADIMQTIEADVSGWMRQFPGCMWAVLTGKRSGVFVLDLDRKGGVDGVEVFAAYCRAHGREVPQTMTQETHSGGLQMFFRIPEGREVKTVAGLMQGIDVRGEGGYACIPPSINRDTGGAYRWINDLPPMEAPGWLLELVCKPSDTEEKPAMRRGTVLPTGPCNAAGTAWGMEAMRAILSEAGQAKEGERNATLNLKAFKLGQIIGGGGIPEDVARYELEKVGLAIGLEPDEIRETIQSGIEAGKKDPRLPAARGEYSIIPGNGFHAFPLVGEDEEPLPLRRPPKAQAPYPVEAFGQFGQTITDTSRYASVPLSMVGNTMLAVASLVAQPIANIKSAAHTTPLSLFCLTVAESGCGKSLVDGAFMRPIHDVEKAMEEQYQRERKAYEREMELYQDEVTKIRKDKKRYPTIQEKRAALDELAKEEPVAPMPPYWTIGDINYEGIYRALTNRPTLGIFSDEGGRLFGGNAFQDENKLKMATNLSSLWSGSTIDKGRHGEGMSKLHNRRLSAHIMLQPELAQMLFADTLLTEQGYLCRQLVSWPFLMAKEAGMQALENLPSVQLFHEAIRGIISNGFDTSEDGGLVFKELRVTHEAQAAYNALFNFMEKEMQVGGEYEAIRGYARRTAEQALRIAGCLAFLDNPQASLIDGPTMERGKALALWYADEMLRIRLDDMASAEILSAEKLLNWLHGKGVATTCVRQVQRGGPNDMREAARIRKAFAILIEHGWLVPIPGGAEVWITGQTTAKSKEAWRVRRAGESGGR